MKRSVELLFVLILVFGFWILDSSAKAEEPFTVKVENQTISIHAKEASALEVLRDLGEKAGIEVRIYDGVEDKRVSLDIKEYTLNQIPQLLQKMGVNYVYGYEEKPLKSIVFVLPGKGITLQTIDERNLPAGVPKCSGTDSGTDSR